MNCRKPTLLELLVISVPFALLAWLNGRPDSDPIRLAVGVGLVLAFFTYSWLNRRSLWRPILAAFLTLILLALLILTSPDTHSITFEDFFSKAAWWLLLASCSWVYYLRALPKATAKYQALGIKILGGVLSIALLASSAAWWLHAVDLYAIPKIPVVTTAAELKAQWDADWGTRRLGIFAIGTIGDAEKRNETGTGHSDFVAYFNGQRPGGIGSTAPTIHLPINYEMRLKDGAKISVQGIRSSRSTYNWPEGGPHLWQYCLRHGDPVVIWADPGQSKHMSTGEISGALNATQIIAYGSLKEFQNNFIHRVARTARIFGWIGLALVPLSLIPGLLGLRRGSWLRKNGSNAPPPVGTKITRT